MSYARVKTVNFGSSRTGLATVAFSLDGGSSWSTTGVSEAVASSGIYKATITFADAFTGTLSWKTGEVSGQRYAAEEINPGNDEYTDAKSSTIPASVWTNGTRTLSAFGFTVSATLAGTGPVFRNQDAVTVPTWDDCLASAWAAANAKEVEDDVALTWVRYLPNGTDPMRSFTLTADANGNPVGRS